MKKMLMMAAVLGLLASCSGGKSDKDAAATDSVTVEIPAVVYTGYEKTVPGDTCLVEITFKIADGDSTGTYERIQTYTYGQTGQKVRTGQDGTVTRTVGTKNDKAALLLTCQKEGEADKITYYEQAADGSQIIQLAEDKGRSANWKDYVYTKK